MYLYAIDYPQYLRRFHGFALLDGQIRCMAPVVPLHAPPDLEAAITAWHHAAASPIPPGLVPLVLRWVEKGVEPTAAELAEARKSEPIRPKRIPL